MVNKYTDSNIEKMAEEMCDKYCKFPGEIKEDDLLQDICNKCSSALGRARLDEVPWGWRSPVGTPRLP